MADYPWTYKPKSLMEEPPEDQWDFVQPPSFRPTTFETPESIQTLYGGYQPPTTPTGQPSIAQTEPTKPAWTEIPPPGMGYNLARGLGAAAAAIAPRSIGGRMGAAAMGLAGQEESNRLQRIRMGSTIQEAQSRTGLAQQLFDMRKQEQERKIASGQQGSSWMRSSGFTKELDQAIGIPGAGEMMALAVENGLFPVHELFSLKQGKDIPVPIEAWEYFGMKTPPDELAKRVGWKTFLEMYKSQQEKPEKTPTPSMYEDVPVGKGDKVQKMKWNPETKAHDIPFGPPKPRSVAHGGSPDYAKTLYLAAKAVGVSPEDIKSGKVDSAQADAILKKMAPMNIWSLLMGGGAANVPKVDKEGNEIK